MSLLWLSDASPLFFYSPSPAYFQDSGYTSEWTGTSDASVRAFNDTRHVTFGSGAVILPSIYGEL